MKLDSRLSVALHLLLHMRGKGPLTSEALGSMLDTHPVVIRRTLAGLRDAGIVAAEKGHRGGWRLATDLGFVSIEDVYDAIGQPALFGIGPRDPDTKCALEQAVNDEIDRALDGAYQELMRRLRRIAVASVAARGA